jgi:hypothetical protein
MEPAQVTVRPVRDMRLVPLVLVLVFSAPAWADDSAYFAAVARLATARATLAEELRAARSPKRRGDVLARARALLWSTVSSELIPAWYGTPWEFYGTSDRPRVGTIACGYFVSTVLRDAGFRVERVKLAQQASELIVKTLVPPESIRRFRRRPLAEVLEAMRTAGPGLYLIGMDFHVGFFEVRDEGARLCHSGPYTQSGVECEEASSSLGMVSEYYVIGQLFTDASLEQWLRQEALPIPTR